MHLRSATSEMTSLISLTQSSPWEKHQPQMKRCEFIVEGEDGLADKEEDVGAGGSREALKL